MSFKEASSYIGRRGVLRALVGASTGVGFGGGGAVEGMEKSLGFETRTTRTREPTEWDRFFGHGIDELITDNEANGGGFLVISGGDLTKLDRNGNDQWTRTIGEEWDDLITVGESMGGGYVSVLYNRIQRLDRNADPQWTRSYDGQIDSITEASTSGFLFVGSTVPEGSNVSSMWIVKINGDGIKQWEIAKSLTGYQPAYHQRAYNVIRVDNGGYLIQVGSYHRRWLIKIDESGTKDWQIDLPEYDLDVWKTRTGAYLIWVWGPDPYLTEIDVDGTEQWTTDLDPENRPEWIIDTGNGFLIAEVDDAYDLSFTLKKIGPDGADQWEIPYAPRKGSELNTIEQGSEGGYLLVGSGEDANGDVVPWLMKVDENGRGEWEQTLPFPTGIDYIYKLDDGGYLIAGSDGQSWLAKRSAFRAPPLPDVNGDGNPPGDPDGDGLYEDVSGDGDLNVGDAQVLYSNRDSDAVQDHVDQYDFNDDGAVNVGDAQALFDEIAEDG